MAGYNGSGSFVRTYSWANDKTNNINITASRFDTEDNGFATGLSTAVCKDGQQTTTARIPFAVGLSVNQGLVGTPSISVIGDNTTGFYQTTVGELRFGSIGAYAATLNANGLDNTVIGAGTPLAASFTTLSASGNFAVNTNKFTVASASGNTLVAGTLNVTSDVAVNTNKFNVTAASGNTTIAGTLGLTSDFAINTNKFNVTASNGNTTVAGTIDVTGVATAEAGVSVNGGTAGGIANGIFKPAAGMIGLASNSSERMRIDSTGRVMINATSTATGYGNAGDVTLAATNAIRSVNTTKAWVNFDGTAAGTISPNASFNVTNITKNGTGDYTLNFTNNLGDANYCISGCMSSPFINSVTVASAGNSSAPTTMTASAVRINVLNTANTLTDCKVVMVQIMGN